MALAKKERATKAGKTGGRHHPKVSLPTAVVGKLTHDQARRTRQEKTLPETASGRVSDHTSAVMWLNLQIRYDLALVEDTARAQIAKDVQAFAAGAPQRNFSKRFNLLESSMASNYLKCARARTIPAGDVKQDSLYEQAADTYGSSLDRLARAYEIDAEVRRDLLQEIHFQLWRSFAHFDGRCSLRTWVYRVAHNVATGHMIRQRRIKDRLVSIETIEAMPGSDQGELAATQAEALDRLSMLIQRLRPLDRQIIVSYLEGMDASSIGELTGLSPANIAMKVHRIKNILRRWFVEGGLHAK